MKRLLAILSIACLPLISHAEDAPKLQWPDSMTDAQMEEHVMCDRIKGLNKSLAACSSAPEPNACQQGIIIDSRASLRAYPRPPRSYRSRFDKLCGVRDLKDTVRELRDAGVKTRR